MKIKDMFAKKIDREIQGVIIVGQGEDANVSQELEEYVVTRELQKHFADFYSAYKKGIVGTTPKMGVWISGFFGSGKSHFLKILSYLLENRQVGDRRAMDYFVEDKKIVDPMVLADMNICWIWDLMHLRDIIPMVLTGSRIVSHGTWMAWQDILQQKIFRPIREGLW